MTVEEQQEQTKLEKAKLVTVMWIALTFILTAAGAGILAELGYISLETPIAILDGLIVASVYVGYRLLGKRSE
ncbi:MAG: hypothetical protein RTU30_06735 [Candidatus Thorarchaeota archaeon]